jgi:hypothetical protein
MTEPQQPGPLEALYETDVQTPGAGSAPAVFVLSTSQGAPICAGPPAAAADPPDGSGPVGAFHVPPLPGTDFEAIVSSAAC